MYLEDTLHYTMTLHNNGPSAANNSSFTFAASGLPIGTISMTCASASGGATCPILSGDNKSGTIATFPDQGNVTINVTVQTIRGINITANSVTTVAEINTPAGTSELNPSSSTSTINHYVNTDIDIAVSVTADTTELRDGVPTTYTYTYTNNGPTAADGITVFQETSGGPRANYSLTYAVPACTSTNNAECPAVYNFSDMALAGFGNDLSMTSTDKLVIPKLPSHSSNNYYLHYCANQWWLPINI